ncbi:MAG: hypothetical protein M0P12_03280 [Paludibacteraceae bacterium]|nr:hypothetical protein [Paludibacteraceae bacterium]
MKKINVNDVVYVFLTKQGKKILKRECAWRLKSMNYDEKSGLYSDELWSLMEDFGPHLFLGCPELPFKRGMIYFEKPEVYADDPVCLGCNKFLNYSDDFSEEENDSRTPQNCCNYLNKGCSH